MRPHRHPALALLFLIFLIAALPGNVDWALRCRCHRLRVREFEEFSVSHGNAQWKNKAEHSLPAPASMFRCMALPRGGASLMRAALANQGRLAWRPQGEAVVRKLGARS